ncbi:hypothetical protein EK904_011414 [Melospiza melodia maxima]|nr:hypothetical protein EK904_011414 [Melospiza melodia maxima]
MQSASLSCVTFPLFILFPQQSGLYEYKIFGGLADIPPKLCADVYMDLDFRKKWDQYVKVQYVYIRESREMDVQGRKIWVVLAKSVAVPQCPEKPGIIRVKSYKQSLVIESDGKAGSKVYMYYFDNPGGMIPTWLVNWAAKEQMLYITLDKIYL